MTVLTRTRFGVIAPSRLVLCAALIAAADFLFYDQSVGWTLGLICALLLFFMAALSPPAIQRPFGRFLFAVNFGLCLTLVESVNWLALALFCLFFAALFTGMRLDEAPLTWLRKLFGFTLHVGGRAALKDARAYNRYRKHGRGAGAMPALFSGWLLPIAISAVFVLLLARANPVLETWLPPFDWRDLRELLMPRRMAFWAVAAIIFWGALRANTIRLIGRSPQIEVASNTGFVDFLFSREAVTRSLVLSNLLFLAQNLLDANFLWAGATLPDGITHAEYAHRGAYPLIATALLAAAFVLIATRPEGGLNQNRTIRALIYVWLLQNLVLVVSSIWRTQLYVAEFSLTYLRLAALLWMGLVLLGLILIMLKIALEKSSDWLIKANIAAALALMTATCFFDIGRFIATFNVAHSQEMHTGTYGLDLAYLRAIGPSALPALRRAAQHMPVDKDPAYIRQTVEYLEQELDDQLTDWRRWTFRAYRLQREMNATNQQ